MKCAGNLGEGAVIFNKSGVGIREDSSIYKCTCSVMYLWFCSLCSFLVLFFFLNISFLKGHLSLPKMSYIWKNLYIKLKLFFFFTDTDWKHMLPLVDSAYMFFRGNLLLGVMRYDLVTRFSLLPSHYHRDLDLDIFYSDFCCILLTHFSSLSLATSDHLNNIFTLL